MALSPDIDVKSAAVGKWPIRGIQKLTGFGLEPVVALRSERLAVFNSESMVVLIGIRLRLKPQNQAADLGSWGVVVLHSTMTNRWSTIGIPAVFAIS